MKKWLVCPICLQKSLSKSIIAEDKYYCFPRMGGCGSVFFGELTPIFNENEINLNYPDFIDIFYHTIINNQYLNNYIDAYSAGMYFPKGTHIDLNNKLLFYYNWSEPIRDIKQYGTNRAIKLISMQFVTDIYKIIKFNYKTIDRNIIILTVPRSKRNCRWEKNQLQFRNAINKGVKLFNFLNKVKLENGVNWIKREVDTQTTHLAKYSLPDNNGPAPYPGITKDTCVLQNSVTGKYVILVDDIYTSGVGVDEDCAQFLLNNGAKKVFLYTLGVTVKPAC